jgi:hypothetical protein
VAHAAESIIEPIIALTTEFLYVHQRHYVNSSTMSMFAFLYSTICCLPPLSVTAISSARLTAELVDDDCELHAFVVDFARANAELLAAYAARAQGLL